MKNVTWQQVVLILGLLACAICAAHFAGPLAGSIVSSVAIVVAWLTDGPNPLLKGNS
jgi:hypothetical protein